MSQAGCVKVRLCEPDGQSSLPKRKILEQYNLCFAKTSKRTIFRLFDCDGVALHTCALFVGGSWPQSTIGCQTRMFVTTIRPRPYRPGQPPRVAP